MQVIFFVAGAKFAKIIWAFLDIYLNLKICIYFKGGNIYFFFLSNLLEILVPSAKKINKIVVLLIKFFYLIEIILGMHFTIH